METVAPSGFKGSLKRPPRHDRYSPKMLIVTFGPSLVALLLGIWSVWQWGWSIPSVDEAIAAIAITGGLLFSLLVFVFQLRLQVSHDPRVQQRLRVPVLIDQLFGTIIVATATAGILVALLLIAGSTSPSYGPQTESSPLHWSWTVALLPSVTFYFTLLLLIVAKTCGAYRVATSGRELRASGK